MAIAHVNRAEGFSITSGTTIATAAANHTTGNLLAVFLNIQASDTPTITDTAGNTWTATPSSPAHPTGVNYIWVFYAANITGNASNVITANWSTSTGYAAISVRQFSGVATTSPLEDDDKGTGISTSLATPSLTVTSSEGVIFAGMEADGIPITGGSGYTFTAITDGFGGYTGDEYKIVTASEAATASQIDAYAWGITAGLFKTGGVATATATPHTLLLMNVG